MDNLGWGEIGAYGGGVLRGAPTPRLDQLAQEGMQLLNWRRTQCTPGRSALMTGRHPIRSGTTKVVWGLPYGLWAGSARCRRCCRCRLRHRRNTANGTWVT